MTDADANRNVRALSLVLLILGAIDLLALVTTLMPAHWIGWFHESCGLGPLPAGKIVCYLARTTSGLYAFHGAMLVFISRDVERYRPLIRFLAWATVVHSVVLLGVGLAERMPLYWILLEGPGFTATGLLLLWLLRDAGKRTEVISQQKVESVSRD